MCFNNDPDYSVLQRRDETQKSVHDWTKETFPDYIGKPGRALALIEEAVELALVAGVGIEAIRRVVQVPISKFVTHGQSESDAGEVADVMSCIFAYAEEAGINAQQELNKKMALNRSRTKEYYAQKTAQKRALGLVFEDEEAG